jgi:hypothetical protein
MIPSKHQLTYKIFYCCLALASIFSPMQSSGFESKTYATNRSNHSAFSHKYFLGINDERKFIWFRVHKAGLSSTNDLLKQNNCGFPECFPPQPFNPAKYKNYFKFGFVRNPWDRVVSCYFNKIVFPSKKRKYFEKCLGKDFEYFVDFIKKSDLAVANPHIRLQTKLLPYEDVDFVGHLENYDEDIRYVAEILNLKISNIPQKNTTQHQHYSTYYTERTKQIIAEKYKEDIEAFGYQFEQK